MTSHAETSAVEYAKLADDVYLSSPKGSNVWGWTRQSFFGDPQNGFFAAAYQRSRSRRLVIAFRGSGGDVGDWTLTGNAGNIAGLRTWDSQLNTAESYFNACRTLYGSGSGSVSVCGHSLGGFLAAMVSLRFNVPGITFNRPPLGASGLRTLGRPSEQLVNFRAWGDYVSALGMNPSGQPDSWGRWIGIDVDVTASIVRGKVSMALAHGMGYMVDALLLHELGTESPWAWPAA